MRQSARRGDRRRRKRGFMTALVGSAAAAGGELVARNPAVAGGFTAFAVVFAYVSANALWYQPQGRGDVFLQTRPGLSFHAIERKAVLPRGAAASAAPSAAGGSAQQSDPAVTRIQGRLHDMGFYDGPVDGIAGPRTQDAIAAFRKAHPSDTSSGSDGAAKVVPIAVPSPRPSAPDAGPDRTTTTSDIPASTAPATATPGVSSADIVRIQAGLKAFGNNDIEIDGMVGTHTRSAIREFQALFHMPVTGQVDTALVDKMRDIGLIN